MYDTCMLIAFLQQLITFGGFYDQQLEFLKLERVQIVCSMNPATTVGRHPLSTRFTAIARIAILDYPEPPELVAVYETLLGVVLDDLAAGGKVREKDTMLRGGGEGGSVSPRGLPRPCAEGS
jgi:dynein heavy chain 2